MTRYRTIVADPPWDLKAGPEFASNGPTRDLPYPTMTLDAATVRANRARAAGATGSTRAMSERVHAEGEPVPANSITAGHRDDCTAHPIYKGDDTKPLLYLAKCVDGCARLEAAKRRGVELAREYGW